MPNKYFGNTSKFSMNYETTIEDHIDTMWSHMEAYGAKDEDVYMRDLLFFYGR